MARMFFRYLLGSILLVCVTPVGLLSVHNKKSNTNAITYKLQGSFETQLQTYFKAKVLSLAFNIPLLYKKKGIFFDQLVMDIEEKPCTPKKENKYKTIVNLDTKKKIQVLLDGKEDDSTLYIVDAFFPSKMFNPNEIKKNNELREELRQMISPRFQIQEVYRPTDCITVAVHAQNDVFTTDQFYIDQIKTISALFYDKPLYVHIFTDDKQSETLIERYKNAVNKPNITFAFRAQTKDSDILEDFFAMTKFDCLIRSQSWLPAIAEIIGDHKIVISPKIGIRQGTSIIFQKTNFFIADILKATLNLATLEESSK